MRKTKKEKNKIESEREEKLCLMLMKFFSKFFLGTLNDSKRA